jgi:cell division protein ZapD
MCRENGPAGFPHPRAVTQNSRMTSGAADITDSPVSGTPRATVYEQPLNERMRTFLRLDFLYSQARYHSDRPDIWSMRVAITARGDVRSEVIKEMERHIQTLHAFQAKPGVDPSRLKDVVANLLRLRGELLNLNANFMHPLREQEFLNAIKHRSAIPGGTCEFDLPDYNFWLHRPVGTRMAMFNQWLDLLRPLCDSVVEILFVTRQSARPREETAVGGVYQINFERDNPTQLLRLELPADSDLYPEISGSHHRCSVRFMSWTDLSQRATQSDRDVRFILARCT